jgi:DNA-binding transcriptional MocR family regulator
MTTTTTTISFARGWPSTDLLPNDRIRQATEQALGKTGTDILNYGAPDGYAPLRGWIANRYGVTASQVLLTNGSLQGLAFLSEHLFGNSTGDAVVEAPTYDRALLILRRFGATAHTVPLTPDGLDVSHLEERLRAGFKPRLVYTIPNFQNPAGVTMGTPSRERLVHLADQYGFYILEDDPYRDIRFEGVQKPTLLSLDKAHRVIYATSFTKSVAPGLRVGALLLPDELHVAIKKLAMDTYVAPGQFAEAVLFEYIQAGQFEPGLATISAALKARRDAMVAALRRELGDRVEFRFGIAEGGYFLWIRLPGVDTDGLAARAEAAGCPVVRGTACYPDRSGGGDELRLAFSASQPEQMAPGIERLARCV